MHRVTMEATSLMYGVHLWRKDDVDDIGNVDPAQLSDSNRVGGELA